MEMMRKKISIDWAIGKPFSCIRCRENEIFVKKIQIQNLGWRYTGEKLKLETKVSLCTNFWGYLHEKSIFWKKLNCAQESSMRLMTWIFLKKNAAQFNEYFEIYNQNVNKMKKKIKVLRIFYTEICYRMLENK